MNVSKQQRKCRFALIGTKGVVSRIFPAIRPLVCCIIFLFCCLQLTNNIPYTVDLVDLTKVFKDISPEKPLSSTGDGASVNLCQDKKHSILILICTLPSESSLNDLEDMLYK